MLGERTKQVLGLGLGPGQGERVSFHRCSSARGQRCRLAWGLPCRGGAHLRCRRDPAVGVARSHACALDASLHKHVGLIQGTKCFRFPASVQCFVHSLLRRVHNVLHVCFKSCEFCVLCSGTHPIGLGPASARGLSTPATLHRSRWEESSPPRRQSPLPTEEASYTHICCHEWKNII